MAGPFLLTEEEQEEESRRQMAGFSNNARGQNLLAGAGIGAPPRPNPPAAPPPGRPVIRSSLFHSAPRADMKDVFNLSQSMVGQQGSHLAGMATQAMSAYGDEHDSRVAQMREMRRQEHEKELMRMRAEAEKRANEATLIRSILADM